jgi:prolyl-tRNA synthetase
MRLSRYYAPTLKEEPADAEVVSHKLMLRAGMIRKLTSGIYTFLPLGLKALAKSARVTREEMDRAGALEILMPGVQPADLWKETGRWDFYGKELLRFKDRHDRDYCMGPTHEEVVTDLIRHEVRSYRQLPLNLYQVQTKFRDEIRPRFGLMRGREFVMKDAYSFDKDEEGALVSYKAMYDAYCRIFTRLGLRFRAVEADTGSIGGNYSHEFMVLADTGEDTIAACMACEYGANLEKAEAVLPAGAAKPAACGAHSRVDTPGAHTVEEVAAFLKIEPARIVKTLLFEVDGKPLAALVRGDRELNDVKLKNALNATTVNLATPEQVKAWTNAPVGFAGPVGLGVETILADRELSLGTDYVVGANEGDAHLMSVDLDRDAKITGYADLRSVTAGDPCPKCGAALTLTRGIEVGHVFKLGYKYSEAMKAAYLDEQGKERLCYMGCYGIGVSRVIAACIEQNHDEWGIKFPPALAPFEAAVVCLDVKGDVLARAEEIYAWLNGKGIEAVLDDRDERPGVKFKDMDLMGFPMQIVVGGKGLSRGVVEVKDRRTGEKSELPVEGFEEAFAAWRTKVLAGWEAR